MTEIVIPAPHPVAVAASEDIDLFANLTGGGSSAKEPEADPLDWDDRRDTVIPEQTEIAVYRNRGNGIVLRARGHWDEESDHFVILSTDEAANAVVAAIKRLQREGGGRG